MKLLKQDHEKFYYQMLLIRRLEEKSAELYQQGKIGGFLHLYIGQEAVSTGLIGARKAQDRVITAYRDHGVAISCGLPVKGVMAELLGKASGVSGGHGGSMHMADVNHNFWGGHAIVGAHLPIATGLALGDQYSGKDAVTICMFGDGATNIGYFHEALNLSKVWNLPVLWVCENNIYGMGTTVSNASAVAEIGLKADGYGIPHKKVDGMQLITVYEASKRAIEKVRSGEGPYLLEIMTYRYRGHSMGDPERYRDQEEIKLWKEKDPISNYANYLVSESILESVDLEKIANQVEIDLFDAVNFAEESPEPLPSALFENVYAE